MQTDRLVTMVNQIAANFAPYPHPEAVVSITRHIQMFWERRMRAALAAHVAAGGAGLSELGLAAAVQVTAAENRP